jgi:hypothetical protein
MYLDAPLRRQVKVERLELWDNSFSDVFVPTVTTPPVLWFLIDLCYGLMFTERHFRSVWPTSLLFRQ